MNTIIEQQAKIDTILNNKAFNREAKKLSFNLKMSLMDAQSELLAEVYYKRNLEGMDNSQVEAQITFAGKQLTREIANSNIKGVDIMTLELPQQEPINNIEQDGQATFLMEHLEELYPNQNTRQFIGLLLSQGRIETQNIMNQNDKQFRDVLRGVTTNVKRVQPKVKQVTETEGNAITKAMQGLVEELSEKHLWNIDFDRVKELINYLHGRGDNELRSWYSLNMDDVKGYQSIRDDIVAFTSELLEKRRD